MLNDKIPDPDSISHKLNPSWITIGAIRTRYYDNGKYDKPTMVLLHEGGYGGDALNTFSEIIPYFNESYRLILPEMLGYGGTDKAVFFGEDPYSPRLRHLESLYSALGIKQAHFIGNSFGGGMALFSSIIEPTARRVLSVTSISGTGGPYRSERGLRDLAEYNPTLESAAALDRMIIKDPAYVEKHYRSRYASSILPGQWEALMALRKLNSPIPRPSTGLPSQMPRILAETKVPVLLVAGTDDPLLDRGWEKKLAQHITNGKIAYVDGAHAPQIDRPMEVARIILDFIENP